MNNAEFSEILRIERGFQRNSFQYRGIYLWPFIRVILGYNEDLKLAKITSVEFPTKKNRFQYLINSWNCLNEKKSFRSHKSDRNKLKQKEVLFISYDQNAFSPQNDDKEDKWYTLLKKNLKEESISLSHCYVNFNSGDLQLWSKTESIYRSENISEKIRKRRIVDSFLSAFDLKNRLLESNSELKEIFQILEESNLGVTITPGALIFRLESIVCQINFYTNFLSEMKCEILFLNAFYSDTFLALTYAANSLGIKTVDVQHGVIGPNHFAYIAWNNCFRENVSFPVPKYCFTWNQIDSNYINQNSYKVTNAITFGNLSKVLDKSDIIKNPTVGSILVTTGFKYIPDTLVDLMNEMKEIKWFLRLHPRYTDQTKIDYYKKKILSHVQILDGKEPIEKLLMFCEFHLTEESAVAWEAYDMGVTNIIVGENGKDIFYANINIHDGFYFYDLNNDSNFLKFLEKLRVESKGRKRVGQNINVNSLLKDFVHSK